MRWDGMGEREVEQCIWDGVLACAWDDTLF
jgi:hypothetical protein